MQGVRLYYEEFKNVLFILGVIGWVIFLIIPMPAFIIDLALATTIGFSLVVLIQASTIDSWEKFKTFPLVLLMATIFRIALNIATTRKIISGESPGLLIESSGHFIIRDQLAIGFVMFIIILIVQFIVAFGANRFGEVSARFTLDALPGKQTSIDNDLNNGIIDAETAKKEKEKLQQRVDYYGSLDGAGKYIKGDVWAGIAMIAVNLIVGLIVGMVNLNLTFTESLNHFTILSVGDGVINLICALMITVSGAIVMARVEESEGDDSGKDKSFINNVFSELIFSSRNLYIVGFVLIMLGIVGLPFIPMFIVGSAIIFVGILNQRNKKKEYDELRIREQERREEDRKTSIVKVSHKVEPITVEVGYQLAPLFKNTGKDIFGNSRENIQDKILIMRQIFANKLGVKLPKIKIRDNVSLDPSTKYEIKVKESLVASGEIKKDKVLAIPSLLTISEIEGEKTKDPIYNQDALWITEDKIDEAVESGYDVWNPLNIIATHIHEVLEKNVWQFISLQEVSNLVDSVGEENPILKEKMDKLEELHLLQKVIISLLKEKVSIKDLPTIIEAFLEAYNESKEIDTIVSLVRQRISRQICENYINQDGKLYMMSLAGEEGVSVANNNGNNMVAMDFEWQQNLIKEIVKERENARAVNIDPVLIVSRPELRPAMSKMLEVFDQDIPVISVFELPVNVDNELIAKVSSA